MTYLKKGIVSFESIAAIIGTILIGTGVAWFVAQNWHQMPSALKIIILLASTGAAYAGGTVLRVREYPLVSKALFILGALLYTLSIFLIAQIYFTAGSTQGIAWLWMISFIGIFVVAHFLESKEAFGIGALEIIIWAAVQAYAFIELGSRSTQERMILIIPFAITGILLGTSAFSLVAGNRIGKSIGYLAAIAIVISIIIAGVGGLSSILLLLPIGVIAMLVRRPQRPEDRISLCEGLLSSTIIFWIALILNVSLTLQTGVVIVFIASVVALKLGYTLKSEGTIYLAMAEIIITVILQYIVFLESGPIAPGYLAVYLLELGVLFYGLSVIHRVQGHDFGKIYMWWTALYLLLFAYLLSFQFTLPVMWSWETTASGPIIFSIILGAAALVSIGLGIKNPKREATISRTELAGMLAIVLLLAAIIAASGLVVNKMGTCYAKNCYEFASSQSLCENAPEELSCKWTNNYCSTNNYDLYTKNTNICNDYNNNNEACLKQSICNWRPDILSRVKPDQIPWSVLGLWIFSNIVFIVVILGAIGYGTKERASGMINLGIMFFALDIVTRYIGFIADYWGYTSLSIIFISGGIILIGGGLVVERWRKRLITEAKDNTSA